MSLLADLEGPNLLSMVLRTFLILSSVSCGFLSSMPKNSSLCCNLCAGVMSDHWTWVTCLLRPDCCVSLLLNSPETLVGELLPNEDVDLTFRIEPLELALALTFVNDLGLDEARSSSVFLRMVGDSSSWLVLFKEAVDWFGMSCP